MVSPGRKLQCISYQHIKFILYLYELKHILLKRMYFREDLPESLNWLAKNIVVYKFCAFLQLSKKVSLKSFFTISILHCYIQYFFFFFPSVALPEWTFLQIVKSLSYSNASCWYSFLWCFLGNLGEPPSYSIYPSLVSLASVLLLRIISSRDVGVGLMLVVCLKYQHRDF